jgi:CheY-like chemotaxis protein
MNSPDRDQKARQQHLPGLKTPLVRAESDRGPAKAGRDGTPIRAVVLDESPMMLKTLSTILQERDDVQLIGTATDGYHALRRVVELVPDLVLLDSRLPGINGLEAARQIKARSQPPAVIVVSADDSPECRSAARAAGTDGFVGKQHLLTKLHAAIRKLFPGPARRAVPITATRGITSPPAARSGNRGPGNGAGRAGSAFPAP